MAIIRVKCLRPFMAKRDKGDNQRQLLSVGEVVSLDDDNPHTAKLLGEQKGKDGKVIGGPFAQKVSAKAQADDEAATDDETKPSKKPKADKS